MRTKTELHHFFRIVVESNEKLNHPFPQINDKLMLKLNAGNKIATIKGLVPVSDIGGQAWGDWNLWADGQNTFVL